MALSDTQYILFLQKGARRVNRDLALVDTTSEIAVSDLGVVTPDDDDLKDILLLATECLIAQRDFNESLSSGSAGVRVKDGEQEVDTRDAAASRTEFFNSPYSPCKLYLDAIRDEKIRRNSGRMVY